MDVELDGHVTGRETTQWRSRRRWTRHSRLREFWYFGKEGSQTDVFHNVVCSKRPSNRHRKRDTIQVTMGVASGDHAPRMERQRHVTMPHGIVPPHAVANEWGKQESRAHRCVRLPCTAISQGERLELTSTLCLLYVYKRLSEHWSGIIRSRLRLVCVLRIRERRRG